MVWQDIVHARRPYNGAHRRVGPDIGDFFSQAPDLPSVIQTLKVLFYCFYHPDFSFFDSTKMPRSVPLYALRKNCISETHIQICDHYRKNFTSFRKICQRITENPREIQLKNLSSLFEVQGLWFWGFCLVCQWFKSLSDFITVIV
jgi:hypothetical protein